MFLSSIHSFRAIAILLIVAGHTIWAFEWHLHPQTRNFLADFFENGTVLFVFVSGFLFQHLSSRYAYGDYLKRKFQHVVLPYLIVSTPAVAYTLLRQHPADTFPQLQHAAGWYQILWFYLKGGAHINYPLWFIPMISLYFLAAPLFMLLVRYPVAYLSLMILVPVSLLLHRAAEPNLDTLHLALYYVSAYVLGMCCSQYRHKAEPWLKQHGLWLMALFTAALLLQFRYADYHGNYEASGYFTFEHGYIDWLYLQKLLLSLGLWGITLRFEQTLAVPLRGIGDRSFSIFFVHVYFIFAAQLVRHWQPVEGSVGKWVVEWGLVVAASLLFAYSVQKILGKNSRFVIGS